MSTTRNGNLPRRRFLRGLGTVIALPALESLAPVAAAAAGARGTGEAAPLRMAFVYHPNGVIPDRWRPSKTGKNYDFSPTLRPLQKFKEDIQVLGGLDHDKAKANGDGAGDHARANATFLTGCQARKTAGADIKLGVSVDQIAAEHLAPLTRLPSLELSCDRARSAGKCDSGYSCAYQFNLAWKTENTPVPPENDPRLAFDRLFGDVGSLEFAENRARRDRYNQSILDFVLDDAKTLKRDLGSTDRRKLDEYLTSVREIERRIERAATEEPPRPQMQRPNGTPKVYAEHIDLMFDLMTVAFQTDTTRVATFMLAHDGSNRAFRDIGVSEGHHSLSHHQNNGEKIEKIARIDEFYVQRFAYFLEKLKAASDLDGKPLLDNCMVVYGSGINDGNRHSHTDLPVVLAGGGGGTLTPGRHVRFSGKPMTNLYLSLLDRMNVPAEQIGDSTGRLENI